MKRSREEIEKDADLRKNALYFGLPWGLLALILEVLLDIRDGNKEVK